jgi:3-oxoacyl-[acyl-carrier-protein] synthase II
MQAHRAALPLLPCQVVACVPQQELEAAPWVEQEDGRRTARFMSYALAAAAEALIDAGWRPETEAQRRATGVAIGAGMSCTADMAEAGVLIVSCCAALTPAGQSPRGVLLLALPPS